MSFTFIIVSKGMTPEIDKWTLYNCAGFNPEVSANRIKGKVFSKTTASLQLEGISYTTCVVYDSNNTSDNLVVVIDNYIVNLPLIATAVMELVEPLGVTQEAFSRLRNIRSGTKLAYVFPDIGKKVKGLVSDIQRSKLKAI